MEYKILEENGVEIENVDDAALHNALFGGKNGILEGVLNSCAVFKPTLSSIAINTGVMVVHGFRIKITDPWRKSFDGVYPSADTLYQVAANIVLEYPGKVSFAITCRKKENLTKDKLFDTGSGLYQAEILTFKHLTSGEISIVDRTMGFLSGGSSTSMYSGEYILED